MNSIEKKSNTQLKIGAILSYLAIVINIVSALIYSPWMLSKIGSGDYGLYSFCLLYTSNIQNISFMEYSVSAVFNFALGLELNFNQFYSLANSGVDFQIYILYNLVYAYVGNWYIANFLAD